MLKSAAEQTHTTEMAPDRPPEAVTAEPARRQGRMKVAALLLLVSSVAAGIWWKNYTPLPDGISRDDYREASRRFRDRFGRDPDRLDVLCLLGEQAAVDQRFETAAICFREIPGDHPEYGSSAQLQEGQVLNHLNRADDAEESFREYLELVATESEASPELLRVAYKWLVFMLSVQLRFEDRKVILDEMHARGLAGVWESKLLYFPHLLIWNSPEGKHRLAEYLAQDPENLHLLLAQGRYLITDGRLTEAQSLLKDLHSTYPDDLRITAARLECHFEADEWDRFTEVARTLPGLDESEPWNLTRMRGQLALHEQRWEDAITAFLLVIRNDATNPWAQMGLAKAHGELNQTGAHEDALQRSVIISEIRVDLSNAQENRPDGCRTLAEACAQIGLESASDCFRQHASRIEARIEIHQPQVATP